MIKVTDLDTGTTVTPSVMHCGKNTTSIPDLCEFAVDVRIMNDAEGARVKNEFDRIMKNSYMGGTTTEYRLETAKLYPFEPNEKILGLLDKVNQAAIDNGFKPFGKIVLGGASDTGAISRAGVPCLCSCGVIGEFDHNLKAYPYIKSNHSFQALLCLSENYPAIHRRIRNGNIPVLPVFCLLFRGGKTAQRKNILHRA